MNPAEGHALYESHGLPEVILRFPWETDNHIGGQRCIANGRAQASRVTCESFRRIPSSHSLQGGVAAALQRKMEMMAKMSQPRSSGAEILRQQRGFQRTEPKPFQPIDLIQRL